MNERPSEDESLYTKEQRKFRRLEVSLPLWLADAADVDRAGGAQWSLGYTRDVSMGGTKVVVQGELAQWKAAAARSSSCLVRFDAQGCSPIEYIPAHIRHVAKEDGGQVWLGVEYDDGAEEEKAAALRAGLRTVKQRRKWQTALAVTLCVLLVAGVAINKLRGDIAAKNFKIYQQQMKAKKLNAMLTELSGARLVSTKAQGINTSFESNEVKAEIKNLQRLNDPKNKDAAESERAQALAASGLSVSNAATTNANVNFGIALPFGYAWPQVIDTEESLLGRQIPTVVIFRDWSSPFPMGDLREARVRAKTLQITWEPHLYTNENAIKLSAIVAGKYDSYIDGWANGAKSYGGEVWIRFAHEFNGNWYPWCASNNGKSSKLYIAAFRHVHDRFTRAGAFNVRWIWCMNAETVPYTPWNDPLKAYPGDSYVDMISIDGYNFGTSLASSHWESFAQLFAVPYSRCIKAFPNKPIMVGETACATIGGATGTSKDKANWILTMDKSLRTLFPRISGVIWFDVQKEADWRMESSPDALSASRAVWNQTYYQRGVS